MHRRSKRCVALILQPCEAREVEIERTACGLCQGLTPDDDECCARHTVQALVGRRGDCGDGVVTEVDRLRPETAHAIDQQMKSALAARRCERAQIVEATGRRFMMDNGNVCERSVGVQSRDDPVQVGRLHPIVLQCLVGNAVLAGDLRDALAVHTVFDDKQLACVRHERGDHAFDCRRARSRDQNGSPLAGVESIDFQQARARLLLQIEELVLAMAQVGLQETGGRVAST